jgi:TRAP-type C4-dicarboxylate transport system substrate-binding protein
VKFKFYPGGVMGDDKAVMRKMRVGQLHGAVVTAGGIMQAYPDIALYNLPMMFRDIAEVDAVRKVIDPKLMAGLEQNKFIGFGLAEVGFAYPMTQQRAASVGQMRAQKVWTPDNDTGALAAFEAFDISPIPLPMADVLAGLQTGLINSVATPPIGAIALQWYTQVQYGLELPLLYVYGLLTMSEKSFNKLEPAEQAIVREELSAVVAEVDASARKDHESATAALTKQGIAWIKPDAAELNEWLDLAAKARARLIANGYVSAQLYNEVEQVLAKVRGG